MLKSCGVGGWVVAHVILVSALGPNPSFFLFWGTFIQLGGLFGQGLGVGLGPGLDNSLSEAELSTLSSLLSFAGHSSMTPMVCPTGDIKVHHHHSSSANEFSLSVWTAQS